MNAIDFKKPSASCTKLCWALLWRLLSQSRTNVFAKSESNAVACEGKGDKRDAMVACGFTASFSYLICKLSELLSVPRTHLSNIPNQISRSLTARSARPIGHAVSSLLCPCVHDQSPGAQHGSTAQSSHAAVAADLAAFGCTVQSKTQPEFRYTAELLLGGETLFSHTKRILSFPHEPFFSSISRIACAIRILHSSEIWWGLTAMEKPLEQFEHHKHRTKAVVDSGFRMSIALHCLT